MAVIQMSCNTNVQYYKIWRSLCYCYWRKIL